MLLTSSISRAGIVSSFFPFLIHLCIRYFHCLWHRDELVHQTVMRHRSKSFAMRSSWFLDCEDSARCLVDSLRFQYTTIHCFGSLLGCNFRLCNHFRDARMYFAQHGWSNSPPTSVTTASRKSSIPRSERLKPMRQRLASRVKTFVL